ncbi:hypothetical protein ACFXA0_04550 [Streptomyces cyaneofuscatus]|uniref:hypothetical protein n=1 Tax=Streptomyces TaxID=1883 RepID=UPI00136A4191|nr:hypothetical protein [Streptomyces sp. SID2119]MYW34051.1 hypothetical protein [Streptomyces sp. SID2119]
MCRYFDSKEELPLELAEHGRHEWSVLLTARLADARDLTPAQTADAVAGTVTGAQVQDNVTVAPGRTANLWQTSHPTPTPAALYATTRAVVPAVAPPPVRWHT